MTKIMLQRKARRLGQAILMRHVSGISRSMAPKNNSTKTPTHKSSSWFRHDSDASNDYKLIALRQRLGWEAVGFFWATIERLRECEGYSLPNACQVLSICLALGSDVTFKEKIENFLKTCIELDLLREDEGGIYSRSLRDRMDDYSRLCVKRKKSAKLGGLAKSAKGLPNPAKGLPNPADQNRSDLNRIDQKRIDYLTLCEQEIGAFDFKSTFDQPQIKTALIEWFGYKYDTHKKTYKRIGTFLKTLMTEAEINQADVPMFLFAVNKAMNRQWEGIQYNKSVLEEWARINGKGKPVNGVKPYQTPEQIQTQVTLAKFAERTDI